MFWLHAGWRRVFAGLALVSRRARRRGSGPLVFGLLSGYMVLQYADVPTPTPAVTGRAMAVFTMAMFLGVALMQWSTGPVASTAQRTASSLSCAVFASIAVVAAGALALRQLPQPVRSGAAGR